MSKSLDSDGLMEIDDGWDVGDHSPRSYLKVYQVVVYGCEVDAE